MAVQALTAVITYIDEYEFTADTTDVSLALEAAVLESTNFASGGWVECVAGLKTGELTMKGNLSNVAPGPDQQLLPTLGSAQKVITYGLSGASGDRVYIMQGGKFAMKIFGAIEELAPFEVTAKVTDGNGVVAGTLAKAKGNQSGTGIVGSAVNLGAPIAGQYVYAAFHVFTNGGSITPRLISAADASFTSPTTRYTSGAITTTGGTWATRVAGPLSGEAYWKWDISALSGTSVVAAAIGIR